MASTKKEPKPKDDAPEANTLTRRPTADCSGAICKQCGGKTPKEVSGSKSHMMARVVHNTGCKGGHDDRNFSFK